MINLFVLAGVGDYLGSNYIIMVLQMERPFINVQLFLNNTRSRIQIPKSKENSVSFSPSFKQKKQMTHKRTCFTRCKLLAPSCGKLIPLLYCYYQRDLKFHPLSLFFFFLSFCGMELKKFVSKLSIMFLNRFL